MERKEKDRFLTGAARVFVAMVIFFVSLLVASTATAATPAGQAPLDWNAWQRLPVHDSGRIMPLDTFARRLAVEICGRENPRLAPAEGQADPVLFPEGQLRQFTAAELVFSWLAEPERWEDVPFLIAQNEKLRRDVLGVPLADAQGGRLKFISPRQFEQSGAAERLEQLAQLQQAAREEGNKFEISEADQHLEQLNQAYRAFRSLTFDPNEPRMRPVVFLDRLVVVVGTWRSELAQPLALWQAIDKNPGEKLLVGEIDDSLQKLIELLGQEPVSLAAAEKRVSPICQSAVALNNLVVETRSRETEAANPQMARQREALLNLLTSKTAQFNRQAHALREAIHDNGLCLNVVPAVDPLAVRPSDEPNETLQPWISLQTLLYGSSSVLQGYPEDRIEQVRKAFGDARAAYLDSEAPDRTAKFNGAMRRFSNDLRTLGEGIEPDRVALLGEDETPAELASTAYPPAGATRIEVFYNRLDPFLWCWIVTLASIACLLLGIGRARKPMFFVGAFLLAAGQAFTVVGLCLRGAITGMVPVSNMYETVLFVSATVGLLGIWFALLPITWPVFGAAWRVTAIAGTPQMASSTGLSGDSARWIWRSMPLLRGALMLCLFYVLSIAHSNPSGDGPILSLAPKFSSMTLSDITGSLLIWLVGLAVLIVLLWLLPRVVLAMAIGLAVIPRAIGILYSKGLTEPIDRALARRPFLLAGATVALLGYLIAYYVPGPVFDREVGSGMAAILRSNLWLTIHVLIITASYGAGALAWGLANLSLGYYALGRYHTPKKPSAATLAAGHRPAGDYHAPQSAMHRRPPAICAKLAHDIYRLIQIAIVLLAAGTVTGAIWADYSWGRYWGWDPKEVWALISLLVYLVVLHGRWAGWTGNFGMAVGAVLGAMAILMAWYGVNFVLPGGLHSYGRGVGGERYVITCVLANGLFVILATVRYWTEINTVTPPEPEENP